MDISILPTGRTLYSDKGSLYGAAEASFGSKNAGDLPVDAHELIALCAPRPTFISYGVPEKGDAQWPDRRSRVLER